MPVLTPQDFTNIKRDIEDTGKAINTDANVIPRYGAIFKSIPMVSRLFEEMIAAGYLTIDELQTAIDIALAAGAGAAGWTDALIQTWDGRNQRVKNRENISAQDYGAAGDGVTNDSTSFSNLEAAYTGRVIDLLGLTYLVTSVPTANNYINGKFLKADANIVNGNNIDGVLTALTDTGYNEAVPNDQVTWLGDYCAFTGGVTNRHTRANIASQICRADFARSMNGASIYSYAGGNISANIAARTSQATSPQTANIGTEECLAQGFAGVNIGAQFSLADGSRCGNVVARYCFAGGGRLASNFGSHQSYAGAGWGLWTDLTFTGGVLTGVTILNGGEGYKTGGTISIQARQISPTTNATLSYTVDSNGTVDSITIIDGGSGYDTQYKYDLRITNLDYECDTNVGSTLSYATGVRTGNYSSFGGHVSGNTSGNLGVKSTYNYGTYCVALGADTGTIGSPSIAPNNSALVASISDTVTGNRSAAIVSSGCTVSTDGSAILAASNSTISHLSSVVTGRRTVTGADRTYAMGDAVSGSALSSNRKIQFGIASGNITATGTIAGSSTFADYAEYFENHSSGEIPLGTLLTLEADKVRIANIGDDVIGVVSGTALIIGNSDEFAWNGRYLVGDFGEAIYEEVSCVRWNPVYKKVLISIDQNGEKHYQDVLDRESYDGLVSETLNIPEGAVYYTETIRKENPDYDLSLDHTPRSERKDDWTCVGLMGQVYVRIDENVKAGDYIKADGGIGTKSDIATNILVMKITKDYSALDKCAIARCLIK